jgi:GTP pyrophosphokinase
MSASLPLEASAQANLPPWLDDFAASHSSAEATQLRAIAREALDAVEREPAVHTVVERSLATARILADLKMDGECLSATLLAALPEYNRDAERLRTRFGAAIARLVEGIRRTAMIEELSRAPGNAAADAKHDALRLESLRKMLLAMAQDVRVVLVKLAERVALMRELTSAADDARRDAARRTMDLFAPLANRLGMFQLKWELEDLSFRLLEPQIYQQIADLLDERRPQRSQYLADAAQALQQELAAHGLAAEVAGRPKHIYSIYKKMQRKHVEFDDLYDVRAVRVLVRETKDCYSVLGIVHNLWQPVPGEFDDYISHPKGNFYRSLHTAVIGPAGKTLEVQIRTHAMHHDSELGIAAHWRYKEGSKHDRKFDEKIAWLRQVLDWKDEIAVNQDLARLFEDTIYVLTPQGQVIDLPHGATAVDFAYHVHTDLGHRCRGAKVNGAIVPLTYRLKNANQVEIVAAKQGGPSRDWLNPAQGYLVSPRALAKVRHWFKQQELDLALAAGRAALDKELQRAGKTSVALDKIARALQFSKIDELLAAIGHGEVSARQVQQALHVESAPPQAPPAEPDIAKESRAQPVSRGVLVLGVNNIATMMAKCCKPVPPEPIVGFVAKARGVIVHRQDCANVRSLEADRRERLMPAQWGRDVAGPFAVDLAVEASDRSGLLRDISEVMAREHVNVTAANTLTRAARARMFFTVEIPDLAKLDQLIVGLKSVPGVVSASRKRT